MLVVVPWYNLYLVLGCGAGLVRQDMLILGYIRDTRLMWEVFGRAKETGIYRHWKVCSRYWQVFIGIGRYV